MSKQKYLRRAQKKLDARIKDYEDMCKRDKANGRGYRKPGSLKMRPN